MKNKLISPSFSGRVISHRVHAKNFFSNNKNYSFLIYKKVLLIPDDTKIIRNFLENNKWVKSWVNGIYNYAHYHSNTHEVLIICQGLCKVQIGGNQGKIYEIEQGDVLIIPAGVSHKNKGCTDNFKCIGAYSLDIDYDMNYGKKSEHPHVDINIENVPLPRRDPIFGKKGLLFEYWKK